MKKEEQVTLEERIVQILLKKKMTITTVESCTGGMISARLTDVAGVSEIFKQGFVTYSDKAKHKMVGVKKSTLKEYTAVSGQTAYEMARGGAMTADADVCVSVTGYAGPAVSDEDDTVGLVYIGCYVKGRVVVEEHHFAGDRRAVREQAAEQALALVHECVKKKHKKE